MKVIKQLSFHNNHVSRVNLYAVNVSKEQLPIHDNHVSRVYLYDEKWVNKRLLLHDNDVFLIISSKC